MSLDQLRSKFNSLAANYRQLRDLVKEMQGELQATQEIASGRRSITEEIDQIPGRRIFYNLNGNNTFTDQDEGRRGDVINFLVSQDGPFVMTHYPLAIWRPSQPATATHFGEWRPVASAWPLPDQVVDGDRVTISYEIVDSGSQRNFQNQPTPPVLSRPDNLVPLPVPTLFTPNTTISFFATFHRILFSGEVAPTEGIMEVALPGYRIVNM